MPLGDSQTFVLPAVAPPAYDMDDGLQTMEVLRGSNPRIILYAHDGVGRDPDRLISIINGSTRMIGDIILKALKEGETLDNIGRGIQKYVSTNFDLELRDVGMLVSGYAIYFKKKGLA